MGDEPDLMETARALRRQGGRAVLATLVATDGPSVRRPGARLLILPDGRAAGFLSAGCVERDLAERLEGVLTTGRPAIVRYEAGSLADPVLGLGLGCGGGMTVMLEPWPSGEGSGPLALAELVARMRRPAALATLVVPAEHAGARAAILPDGRTESAGPPGFSPVLKAMARDALRGACGLREAGGLEIFAETMDPPLRLLLHGKTGPAPALARIAGVLGWQTVELSDPGASRTAAGSNPLRDQDGRAVDPDRWTVAALLAHDTAAEVSLVAELLGGGVPYVGVMGSRRRREQLIAALREAGLPEIATERLHMPIGLDTGAEGAAEIALAAAAEILAVLRGRTGGRLSATPGPVHAR